MTLKVLVHPRDIVSVPEDCAEQKVWVSRYRVLEATVHEIAESTYDVFMDGFVDDDEEDDNDGFDHRFVEDNSDGIRGYRLRG